MLQIAKAANLAASMSRRCLQEISYLTSTSTLNPLPDRSYAGTGGSLGIVRPRKALPEIAPQAASSAVPEDGSTSIHRATLVGRGQAKGGTLGAPKSSLASQALPEESSESGFGNESSQVGDPLGVTSDTQDKSSSTEPLQGAAVLDDRMAPPPAPSAGTTDLPAEYGSDSAEEDEPNQVTARYRGAGNPADATASDWAKLKEAGQREREKRERQRRAQAAASGGEGTAAEAATLATTSSQLNQLLKASPDTRSAEDELANLSLTDPADEAAAARAQAEKIAADDEAADRLWKSKRVLRNHLDAVRAIAFDSTDAISASDDNTIKFWHLDPATLDQPSRTAADNEPILTFRGHTAPVTCLAVASATRRMFSGSMDSSVRVWKLPERPFTPYPPYENMEVTSLAGHTQAVWDMALLPQQRDGMLLATASADGTVKIWTTDEKPSLHLSWDYNGADGSHAEESAGGGSGERPVPTSVCVVHSDLRTVAVSYSNSIVKLFELESGREVLKLKSDSTYQGTPATQINKIVAHPTLPFLVSAHEDRHIRVFDLGTGDCTFEMLAHLDAVTALDIDPAGLTLVSGGHDCSVRFWDINGITGGATGSGAGPTKVVSKTNPAQAVCVQEISAHRPKSSEGVLAVLYHPSAPFFASSGADGVVRIYG